MGRIGRLGNTAQAHVQDAEQSIRQYTTEYSQIIRARPKAEGLPPHIQAPKNAIRWQPKDSLAIPAVPAGVDQAVLAERVPLGYDGVLIALTNIWNGTGFVEASGDITWRYKIDNRFVAFFEAVTTSLGSLTIPFDISGQGIPLLSGQLVQVFASFAAGSDARLNNDGKTVVAVTGNIWPRERLAGL